MKISRSLQRVTLVFGLLVVVAASDTAAKPPRPSRSIIHSSTIKHPRRSIPNLRERSVVHERIKKDAGLVNERKDVIKPFKKSFKATTNSKTASTFTFPTKAIVGSIAMAGIERGIKKVFASQGIAFPAQLGGCIVLFFALLIMNTVVPGSGDYLYQALGPATTLLTKWLPVFFVPGLAMLPLAPSAGSGMEVAKILLVTCLGFVYSLLTVAYSVLFLRKAEGKVIAAPIQKKVTSLKKKAKAAALTGAAAAPKAYSDATMALLAKTTVVSGVASVLVRTVLEKGDAPYAKPLQSFFFFSATCATYVWGARLPPSFTKAIHPLLTSTGLVWGVLYWYGLATSQGNFMDMVKTYKTGSLELSTAGAGDVLLFLLGPSVVSFAVSMYSRKQLLKENFWIVVVSMMVSSLGALFGTAGFVQLIQLGGTSSSALMLRLSMLARNVTTALAIPITQILGGDVSIAVVVVVLTGILGAQYGRRLLDLVGIQDPVTRGLAVGSSAQGLGVSSMVPEPDAFPFAAMAMVLTAVAGTVIVSIPQIKDVLVSICS